MTMVVAPPDIHQGRFGWPEGAMIESPGVLFQAGRSSSIRRFAVPGSVLMKAEINVVFYFEAHFEGERHPHYGRFLGLVCLKFGCMEISSGSSLTRSGDAGRDKLRIRADARRWFDETFTCALPCARLRGRNSLVRTGVPGDS